MGFNELFRQAVRSGLGDTLGEEALAAFLYHSHLDLNKAEPNDIHKSLLAIFIGNIIIFFIGRSRNSVPQEYCR